MLPSVAVQSTERTPPARRHRVARVEPYLFAILEGARPDAGGMRVALCDLQTLHIGRGDARVLHPADGTARLLEIPDCRMSGTHARIVRTGTEIVVEDAGSTNGTLVNGELISSHVLRDSDII